MPDVDVPETRYAKTVDGVHVAYQVRGDGPVDLVYVTGFASCFEVELEEPRSVRFFGGLSSFSRLILFDKRGTGLSDRRQTPDLDMRADDLRAVLDAAGSERAILFGESEGGMLATFFAATHPERVLALILYGSYPNATQNAETESEWRADIAVRWGTLEFAQDWLKDEAPSLSADPDFVRWFAKLLRHAASPAAALEFEDARHRTDVSGILGSVQAPTLVLWRAGVWDPEPNPSRTLAYEIPGAEYQELSGRDHFLVAGDLNEVLRASERFVRSVRAEEREISRVLVTVLFTDIVGSTTKATTLGDSAWKDLLERHHGTVRALLGRYRGQEVDTAGDGFFATFDGPARAVRCAQAVAKAVKPLGLEIRAGIHAGEVESIGDKVAGITVIIGSRIGGLAGPSEVLVSQTVKDLVAGSGLNFQDRGEHELKGVQDLWRLYRVLSASA
jgi:class 3 adenylate cyclase